MAKMLWDKVLFFIRGVFSNQMFLTIVTLLLGVIAALVVWRITTSQSVSKKSIPHSSPKLISRRIRDIPEGVTKEELQRQLELELDGGEDGLRLTLARSSPRFCMATITSFEAPKLKYPVDTSFIGVTPLFESSSANVDIIFLPGLGSHAIGGFRSKDGNNVWPRDFLPEDIPTARVLVYGYDTTITKGDASHSIIDLAMAFLDSIRAFRAATGTRRRPIVLIGHSLGGLLMKTALAIAYDGKDDESNSDFFNASYGLIFFGVPNLGLKLGNLDEITAGQLNQQLIHDLEVNKASEATPFLQELKDKFTRVCHNQDPKFKIITYYERRETRTAEKLPDGTLSKTGPLCFVVTRESACRIGIENNFHQEIPLDVDHSNLVKFSSRSDDAYGRVLDRMKELVRNAPSVVNDRFSWKKKLSPDELKHWNDLNVPDYKGFKETEKVANPSKGTLQWLVKEPRYDLPCDSKSLQKKHFELWRDSTNSTPLLVCGAPGQGKSVLSNFVIDHLKDINKTLSRNKIIYYFCNVKNDESERTASSILRALIVQLCEDRRIFQNLPNRFQEKNQSEKFHKAHFNELWSTLEHLAITPNVYNHIYCVIDGLDVYQTDMKNLLLSMKKLFTSTIQAGMPVLKLFCTSRPIKNILRIKIKPCKILRASSKDLRLFIQTRLERFSLLDPIKKEFIQLEVEHRTDRTFLWISIVLRRLEEVEVPSDYEIKKVVNDSPAELQELYKNLIREAFRKHKAFALILAWITFAKRPLSLSELEVAIAIGMSNKKICWQDCSEHMIPLSGKYIQEHLGTLVDVVGNSPFLIHQSLRDFLLETELWQESPVMSNFRPPELLLADGCMSYLAFKEFQVDCEPLDKDFKFYPLLRYTSDFWYTHIHTQEEAQRYLRLLEIILGWPSSTHWMTESKRNIIRDSWSVFEIAVICDIDWLANMLLNKVFGSFIQTFDNDCLAGVAKSSPRVLKQLLIHPEFKSIRVAEEVIEAAAGNQMTGKEVMIVLLQERDSEFKITEEVVKAAVGNQNGKEIIALLLQERGSEFKISEEVVKAAAGNWNGKEIITLLLRERGSEFKITEEVVKTAAKNSNQEVIALLLQERDSEFKITEEVAKAAAGNFWIGKEIIALLLQERGSEFKITEEVVKAAVGNQNGKWIIALLLQERGSEFKITEEVVKAAVGNQNGKEIITLLLQKRGSEFKITEEVVKAAAGNFWNGKEIIVLLLQERGSEFKITEEVVEAAAGNLKGKGVMVLLLQERGSEFKITEQVVKAAAGNLEGKEIIALLLQERGSEFKITEEVVKTVAKNSNQEVIALLLQERGSEFKITEEVVKAAAGNFWNGKEIIVLLLQERGSEFKITEEVVEAAAGNLKGKGVMVLLLQERGSEFKITEQVVKAAAGNFWNGKEIIALLLQERGSEFKITEEVVKAAVGNQKGKEIITLLLQERGSEFKITEEVVKTVAKNSNQEVIALLLQERGSEFKITEEVVKAAVGNQNGKEIITLLLQERGSEFKISEGVVKAVAANGKAEVLHLFKQHFGIDISSWVPIAQLYNASKAGNKGVVQAILDQGVDPSSKDNEGRTLLWWSASAGHLYVTNLLLERNVQLNEADSDGWTPLHAAAIHGHLSTVKLLLSKEGIDPNLVDVEGRTALALATQYRVTDVAYVLRRQAKLKEMSI